jgi:hypothetical protein
MCCLGCAAAQWRVRPVVVVDAGAGAGEWHEWHDADRHRSSSTFSFTAPISWPQLSSSINSSLHSREHARARNSINRRVMNNRHVLLSENGGSEINSAVHASPAEVAATRAVHPVAQLTAAWTAHERSKPEVRVGP